MEIQTYSVAHHDQVMALFEHYPEMFEDEELEIIEQDLDKPDNPSRYIRKIILNDSQLIGFAYAGIPADSTYIWKLNWIIVKPTHRSQGFGTKLLQAIETEIKALNGKTLFLETLAPIIPLAFDTHQFYLKRGFKQMGEIPGYWSEKEAKVIYHKQL